MMALGLELAKPLAVHAIFGAARAWRIGQALALLILASVAVGYSITAELQLMALSRADAIAGREHASGTASTHPGPRPRPAKRATPSAPIWRAFQPRARQRNSNRSLTPRLPPRRAPIARNGSRAPDNAPRAWKSLSFAPRPRGRIVGQISPLASRMRSARLPPPVPSAAALATYLGALGLQIEPRRLGYWLVLVAVFALEVGSMFAAVLVAATRPNARRYPAARVSEPLVPAPPRDRARNTETPALPAPERLAVQALETLALPVPSATDRLEVAEHPAERVLALVRDKGGEVFGSQRTLALAVGVSPAQLNRVLHDLAGTGRVNLCAGRAGTRVRIAH